MKKVVSDIESDVEEEIVGKEKNPKIGMIIGLIVGAALLIGCVCGVGFLLGGIVKFGDSVEKIIEDDTEVVQADDEDEVPTENTKNYIGNSNFGYLEVDKTWTSYESGKVDEDAEVEGDRMLHYGSGLYFISLYAIPKLQGSSDDYQASILSELKEEGIKDVSSETTKLGNYDAYKTKVYFADRNMYLVVWIFEAEDNKTHYISIEGPDEHNAKFEIPASFTLKKEE